MPHETEQEERNKAILRRWFEEVWNARRDIPLEEIRDAEAVSRGLGETGAAVRSASGYRTFFSNLTTAFPDLQIEIEDMIAEGDKVAARLSASGTHRGDSLGVAPTGKRVQFGGMVLARFQDGKIWKARITWISLGS